jgi:Na+/H+ antiporter NhaB
LLNLTIIDSPILHCFPLFPGGLLLVEPLIMIGFFRDSLVGVNHNHI